MVNKFIFGHELNLAELAHVNFVCVRYFLVPHGSVPTEVSGTLFVDISITLALLGLID